MYIIGSLLSMKCTIFSSSNSDYITSETFFSLDDIIIIFFNVSWIVNFPYPFSNFIIKFQICIVLSLCTTFFILYVQLPPVGGLKSFLHLLGSLKAKTPVMGQSRHY